MKTKVENVQIVDEILQKLKKSIRMHDIGVVVGWKSKNCLIITGCISAELSDDVQFLDAFLPGDIVQISCSQFDFEWQQLCDILRKEILDLMKLVPSGFSLYGTYNDDEGVLIERDDFIVHFWLAPDDSLQCLLNNTAKVEVKVITGEQAVDNFAVNSILFQVKGMVNVKLVVENGRYEFDHTEVVTADSIFKLIKEDLMLTYYAGESRMLKDIKQPIKNFKDFVGPKKFAQVFDCHQVSMLTCISSGRTAVPYFKHDPYFSGCRFLPCFINALCLVKLSTPLVGVPRLLRTAVNRQLYLLKKVITDLHDVSRRRIPLPSFHHFFIPGWCHPVSACFPANHDDKALESYRKNFLHPTFLIQSDQPVFRRIQEEFVHRPDTDSALVSPHLGVKPPSQKHGKVVVMDSAYAYYHYNQNNFNDNGWGCAYRSLQTLISWCRLQGYTDKPIPNHEAIQKMAVEAGDRPKRFVKSKEWIGAIEVSHVLTAYTGLETKILHVSCGSDLNSVGRQLMMHFQRHGTPVMIGGGVFAHTILGVCFNDKTGDTLFLVLDPHYVGPENLEKIISRGWCGWKNLNFWNQNAFYNLCLPQRPTGV